MLTRADLPPPAYPDVDPPSCQLLGPTALVRLLKLRRPAARTRISSSKIVFQIVQGLMGVLVILSLVYKRHRETPKRPWKIWFALSSEELPLSDQLLWSFRVFDVSKQVAGQSFVHGINLLASGLFSLHTDGNACVSYFLNILIDTTFGGFSVDCYHII